MKSFFGTYNPNIMVLDASGEGQLLSGTQLQQGFYGSNLFNQLFARMCELAGEPSAQFEHYEIHLQRMAPNLYSYLTPNSGDIFWTAISKENQGQERTAAELDVIILRLVKAQDREWDNNANKVVDIKTKLNNILASPWKFHRMGDVAWCECDDRATAEAGVATLKESGIACKVETNKDTKKPLIYVRDAYHQVKFNLSDTLSVKRSLR